MPWRTHFILISELTSYFPQGGYWESKSPVVSLWQQKMSLLWLVVCSSPFLKSTKGQLSFNICIFFIKKQHWGKKTIKINFSHVPSNCVQMFGSYQDRTEKIHKISVIKDAINSNSNTNHDIQWSPQCWMFS